MIWGNDYDNRPDRAEWLLTEIYKIVKLRTPHEILDVGCGSCRDIAHIHNLTGCAAHGIDLNYIENKEIENLSIARHIGEAGLVIGSFLDNYFDLTMSIASIEHMYNANKVFMDMIRVSKKYIATVAIEGVTGENYFPFMPDNWAQIKTLVKINPPDGLYTNTHAEKIGMKYTFRIMEKI